MISSDKDPTTFNYTYRGHLGLTTLFELCVCARTFNMYARHNDLDHDLMTCGVRVDALAWYGALGGLAGVAVILSLLVAVLLWLRCKRCAPIRNVT